MKYFSTELMRSSMDKGAEAGLPSLARTIAAFLNMLITSSIGIVISLKDSFDLDLAK